MEGKQYLRLVFVLGKNEPQINADERRFIVRDLRSLQPEIDFAKIYTAKRYLSEVCQTSRK